MTSCRLIWKSLAAALRRESIIIIADYPLFTVAFTVVVFYITRPQRASAVFALKKALAELELLDTATIATDRAGESWIILQGIGEGGTRFEENFLKPEYLTSTIAAFEKHAADYQMMFNLLFAPFKRPPAADNQTPEGNPPSEQ